jgi:hypothetical protein
LQHHLHSQRLAMPLAAAAASWQLRQQHLLLQSHYRTGHQDADSHILQLARHFSTGK